MSIFERALLIVFLLFGIICEVVFIYIVFSVYDAITQYQDQISNYPTVVP